LACSIVIGVGTTMQPGSLEGLLAATPQSHLVSVQALARQL
jgi:hypothetical protein